MYAQLATLQHNPLAENAERMQQILRAIHGVCYGQVQIIGQDSRVVHIDKIEKPLLV